MRYPASEKLEIIHPVERSHLPVRRILDKLGIPATTFYRWYDAIGLPAKPVLETVPVIPAGCGTVSRTASAGRSWS